MVGMILFVCFCGLIVMALEAYQREKMRLRSRDRLFEEIQK